MATGLDLKAYPAVDTMCRPGYCDPEFTKSFFDVWEQRIMAHATFKGVMKRLGIEEGQEWKALGSLGKSSVEEMIQEMDEIGVEIVFIDQMVEWSLKENREIGHYNLQKLAELMNKSQGRIVGGAGYNPFRITESLRELETAVKEFGFKYVWFDIISFGVQANDRRCYPLYHKCVELGIPCCIQVGHNAKPIPSAVGHPMYAGDVAFDFPELTLVLTHTGWPWIDEWISMIWTHPNVYGNIGAYYPKSLSPSIVKFMDGRGRHKIMWATNGLGLTRCKSEYLELPLREESRRSILRDNAVNVFHLDIPLAESIHGSH